MVFFILVYNQLSLKVAICNALLDYTNSGKLYAFHGFDCPPVFLLGEKKKKGDFGPSLSHLKI
jgi:hypothetical protein